MRWWKDRRIRGRCTVRCSMLLRRDYCLPIVVSLPVRNYSCRMARRMHVFASRGGESVCMVFEGDPLMVCSGAQLAVCISSEGRIGIAYC